MNANAVLELLPQSHPFRFVDELSFIDENKIVGSYTFKGSEDFFKGHFPGNPVAPGVIILESMAQVGIVCHALHLLSSEMDRVELAKYLAYFTEAAVEFMAPVRPGDKITITGEKVFWRRKKISSQVTARKNDGTIVASGRLAGMAVLDRSKS